MNFGSATPSVSWIQTRDTSYYALDYLSGLLRMTKELMTEHQVMSCRTGITAINATSCRTNIQDRHTQAAKLKVLIILKLPGCQLRNITSAVNRGIRHAGGRTISIDNDRTNVVRR
jgi:hypothetical protein